LIRIDPPDGVAKILKVLSGQGFEAYLVGGCVRDTVMGREPKDWDIATDARPEEVGRLFEKTVDTGIKHGTVSVILGNKCYEVTTFRIDGRYADSRHPDRVEFTSRLEDDLRRRDFTINAMAWAPEEGIIDPFGGMRDISARIIRTVGKPADRFGEDALRMLRAVRFAAVLGFGIEEGTIDGIRQNSSLISRISAERIREELTAVLVSDDPGKFMILSDMGLLRYILPELEDCLAPEGSHTGVLEHRLHSVAAADADMCMRWAMLLHETGRCSDDSDDGSAGTLELPKIENRTESEDPADTAEIAGNILDRLRFDNKSKNRILRIVTHLGMRIEPERSVVARAVLKVGKDIFADLLKAKRAHIQAVLHHSSSVDASEELHRLERTEAVYRSLLEGGYCLSLKELAIDGNDLKRLGFRKGVEIGETLDDLLGRVIDEPGVNKKEILEKMALDHLKSKREISAQ
jgi:tRNA nucleotidyltransferase (CCA-adding enzyme)